jgi:predicted Zn-dependent peptidase
MMDILRQNKILKRINKETATTTVTPSSADELRKFKELLDSGIITQEEFDTKKKQLLGL